MDLSSKIERDVQIVTAELDRIDAAVAIQFKDWMRDVTAGNECRVILDLGKVGFIDSSGLGAIVASLKQMPDGRRLDLACLQPTVEKVFRLTRMDTVFAIHRTVAEGLGHGRA
ncbi:STAS domain-containing protein [Mesobacterium pallidum]|uniref:STAS domain-containing protein n=1 Tax=Mesobacterium pallidum TaxID=2872037 RepID=UPI001EE2DDF1|nr:STAS domain-containing protein [Mesobacterium pallidum]